MTFAPSGELIIGIDGTIERRRGAKIKAKGIYREPVRASQSHFVEASGLRWKRYLNMTPDQLQKLFTPLEGQVVEDVKRYGLDVLQQLREALAYTDIANLIASLETRS
jgi:hypothetical protein